MIKIEELAMKVGVSVYTINHWYTWRKYNSEHELASLLPQFIQKGARQTRYWKEDDVELLKEFKEKIPHGRNGILNNFRRKNG